MDADIFAVQETKMQDGQADLQKKVTITILIVQLEKVIVEH